ncbi:MAG: nitroreductase, partial [Myxococcota bacterium]
LAARGYGSCPQTALSFEAEYVREALSVGDEWKLMFGISFGRPDPAGDANRCVTDRAKLSDYVEFHD